MFEKICEVTLPIGKPFKGSANSLSLSLSLRKVIHSFRETADNLANQTSESMVANLFLYYLLELPVIDAVEELPDIAFQGIDRPRIIQA